MEEVASYANIWLAQDCYQQHVVKNTASTLYTLVVAALYYKHIAIH